MKRRKAKRNRPVPNEPAVCQTSDPVAPRPRRLRGWRAWLVRLTLLIVSPILFFGLLEAGLRLAHYGYSTRFFLGPDAEGAYSTNPQFGWRFFPQSLARSPQPCVLAAKPAGAIRIFVLGSSAAMGTPEPSFNFGRILEVMLRHRYPGTQFEVVNAAMTAINSHTTLEIARDCAAHQPDLFVVYMGNNEVVGPYGPGTVFQQWLPNLTLIRASIWAKSMRVGQLFGNIAGYFRKDDSTAQRWRGMEMFLNNRVAADDPRLAKVYDNFRRNLLDLCGVARRAGAPIVLSTIAVNLQECPPLASVHRPGMSPAELAQWETTYKAGIALEAQGRNAEAIKQYEAAAALDPDFAEVHFRLGRCLAVASQFADARREFIEARDLDALRFRADSHINTTIRDVAAEKHEAGVYLADAERAIAASKLALGGIPGEKLFYEHVHLTFDGNYLLARTVCDEVAKALPESIRSGDTESMLSREECAKSLVLTSWDQYTMAAAMAELTSKPPFTEQMEHAVRQAAAMRRTEELRAKAATQDAVRDAMKAYETAVAQTPDDWQLHQRFGALAMRQGRFDEAAKQLGIVADTFPQAVASHIAFANALREQGKLDEAVAEYNKALKIEPNHVDALINLSDALFQQNEPDRAMGCLQKAVELDPQSAEAQGAIGVAMLGRGQTDDGMAHLHEALRIQPDSPVARYNLAQALARQGRSDEAIAQYGKTLAIRPEDARSHAGLAAELAKRGNRTEAIAHYRRAVELRPTDADAHINLAVALTGSGQTDEAIAEYHRALQLKPDNSEGHNNLGALLANRGHFEDAIVHFRKAVTISPRSGEPWQNFGAALYRQGRVAEAIARWHEGIRACPDHAPLLNQMARVLATCGDASLRNGEQAVNLAQHAVQVTGGQEPTMLDTLAAAYAETARFSEAIETAQRAESLASKDASLASVIRAHIKLYQANSPLRDSAPKGHP